MIGLLPLLLLALAVSTPDGPGRVAAEATAPVPGCTDFLARMHRKPPHVTFVGCRLLAEAQGRPLRATYRVEGRYAGAAEAYFGKAIGLARLRRSCCQWDAPPRSFVDKQGRAFTLAMVSDETKITRRNQWNGIRHFEITVETLTEEI